VRTDTFKSTLSRHIGNEIRHASMFTMARDYEESDSVGPIYHKSLLYLVSRALEREDVSPILGLETSLRGDAELARTFGLSGPTPHAEVVWAVTSNQGGRAASTSRTHGGFDNNAPTMNSVLRRVLARADNAAIVEYPKDVEERAVQAIRAATRSLGTPAPAAPAGSTPAMSPGHGSHSSPQVETGRRRALCVGIDDYASAPLAGCVADANAWKAALEARGFEVTMLVNEAATRQALMTALETLVKESEAGDVAVFQYAGHGTQLPDANPESDEDDGQDEAFCPFDMDDGAFLVDDDVRGIFAAIPAGVNVTCFIDCCHSGSISRAGGVSGGTVVRTTSVRPRFIRATAAMKAAHRAFRKKEKKGRATRAALPPATLAAMKQVVFSACQDREVAYESDGHGDFTTRALPLLAAATNGMTHDGFQQAVIEAFGAGRRQSPNLECAPAARDRVLLAAYRFPFFSSDIR
jgi:hypothetical protein